MKSPSPEFAHHVDTPTIICFPAGEASIPSRFGPTQTNAAPSQDQGTIRNLLYSGWQLFGDLPMRPEETFSLTVTLPNEHRIGMPEQSCGGREGEQRETINTPDLFSSGAVHIDRQICLLLRIRRHSGHFCRRNECRSIFPDEFLHAQRHLPC